MFQTLICSGASEPDDGFGETNNADPDRIQDKTCDKMSPETMRTLPSTAARDSTDAHRRTSRGGGGGGAAAPPVSENFGQNAQNSGNEETINKRLS